MGRSNNSKKKICDFKTVNVMADLDANTQAVSVATGML